MKAETLIYGSHVTAGIGHITSAIVLLALGAADGWGWRPDVFSSYERWNEVNGTNEQFMEAKSVRVNLVVFCFLFAFWSGLLHFVSIYPPVWKAELARYLKGGSLVRALDYGLSSSLMIVVLAIFSGVREISTLIVVFVAQALVILCGYLSELDSGLLKGWTGFNLGCVVYIANVWLPVILAFALSVDASPDTPEFVPAIFTALFVVFSSFAVVAFLRLWYKPEEGSISQFKYELAYIILSLVAKTLLHWTLYSSVLGRPESGTPRDNEANWTYATIGIVFTCGLIASGIIVVLWKRVVQDQTAALSALKPIYYNPLS